MNRRVDIYCGYCFKEIIRPIKPDLIFKKCLFDEAASLFVVSHSCCNCYLCGGRSLVM